MAFKRVKSAIAHSEALPAIGYDYANGQKVAFTATSAESAAVNSQIARIVATQDCFVLRGTSPQTALADGTGGQFLPAGVVENIGLTSGEVLAVIREDTDGNLFIVPGDEV